MCTVTLIARRDGYALGMNRDEKLARATGLPPARHRLGSRDALAPSEPSGGTWIGLNDAGATLALINWYSVPTHVAGQTVSRGQVVRLALPSDSSARVDAALAELPLARVNPFRLIGVFPTRKAVVEWRWNLKRLERLDHRLSSLVGSGTSSTVALTFFSRGLPGCLHVTSLAGTLEFYGSQCGKPIAALLPNSVSLAGYRTQRAVPVVFFRDTTFRGDRIVCAHERCHAHSPSH